MPLLRSVYTVAQPKGKTMKISKPKMRMNPSYLWRVRNPSIWNDWEEGHNSIELIAEDHGLSIKTVENILRAYRKCPENPRRYFWEQNQGWKWTPSLASIRKANLLKYQGKAASVSRIQTPQAPISESRLRRGLKTLVVQAKKSKTTSTYMTFTYEGKDHTIEATTFGAILDLWHQDRSIASLITKVETR